PPSLGISFLVEHPESETDPPCCRLADRELGKGPLDADGHAISFRVHVWKGQALAAVTIRRGVSPQSAAAILRKLADHIEGNGWIMRARQGEEGDFDADGAAQRNELMSLDYDDFGNLEGERPQAE